LALASSRFPPLAQCLPLLQGVQPGWYLGEDARRSLHERVRVRLDRNPQPSAGAIVDSQSLKSTGLGGGERGYDGAKKVKGLKSVTCS
jgi:hypothetical protein